LKSASPTEKEKRNQDKIPKVWKRGDLTQQQEKGDEILAFRDEWGEKRPSSFDWKKEYFGGEKGGSQVGRKLTVRRKRWR